MVIALDMQVVIRNVILVEHHEPIVLIGIPEKDIAAVLDKYIGMNIALLAGGLVTIIRLMPCRARRSP